MIIDSHAHTFKEYYSEEELKEILEDKNLLINVVAYDLKSAYESVEIAGNYRNAFATIGFHPYDVDKLNDETYGELKSLLRRKKIIALGEIGLDYFRDLTSKESQIKGFIRQIELAKELNLPIVIHSRDSFFDTLSILDSVGYFVGVFHSFDYGIEELKKVLDRGFYVSFSGMVTFNKRNDLREAAKFVPLDRLLLETDSPYLAPVPLRGTKNRPQNVRILYEFFANLSGLEKDLVYERVCKNFFEIFRNANLMMGKEVACLKS